MLTLLRHPAAIVVPPLLRDIAIRVEVAGVVDLPGAIERTLAQLRLTIRIRIGPVVAEIRSSFAAIASGVGLHYAAHEVATREEFADFHVAVEARRGIRGWIRPQAIFRFDDILPFKPLAAAQAFPLLEWGLNWCVSAHCHQYLIVHAAVVERDGRVLILPAPPGSGKSTLCAALIASGWRLFSDELALIDAMSGRVVPLPRPISLKNESIDIIGAFWPGVRMNEVVHDTMKGSVVHVQPPADSVRRWSEGAAPGWVVIPRYVAGRNTELAPLDRSAAFMRLVESAFNYSMHGRTGFERLANLVTASECFRFTYGGALTEAVRVLDRFAA